MKKNKKPDKSKVSVSIETDKISRKEAIIKAGKITALTVATMTIISTKKAAATSPNPQPPGW